jgi:hypothetical protein
MEASAHPPACGALRLSAAHGGAVRHSQLSERIRHNDDSPAVPNNPRTQQRSTVNSRAPPSSAAHSPTAPHTAMPQPEFRSLKIYRSGIERRMNCLFKPRGVGKSELLNWLAVLISAPPQPPNPPSPQKGGRGANYQSISDVVLFSTGFWFYICRIYSKVYR